jgi:hypothetical protein
LSSTSILHGLIVKLFLLRRCTTVALLPPSLRPTSHQPPSSSTSAAAHVLCLCRRTFVDCCFLSLSSASLLPLCQPYLLVLCSIRHDSSANVVLHLILPPLLVHRCACCALVDCCLLLVAVPLLPLRHPHSCCLSVVVMLFAGVPHYVQRQTCNYSDLPGYFF